MILIGSYLVRMKTAVVPPVIRDVLPVIGETTGTAFTVTIPTAEIADRPELVHVVVHQ